MSLQIAIALLYPIAWVHSLECLLDLLIPVTERHNGPLEDSNDVQCNALADPKSG